MRPTRRNVLVLAGAVAGSTRSTIGAGTSTDASVRRRGYGDGLYGTASYAAGVAGTDDATPREDP